MKRIQTLLLAVLCSTALHAQTRLISMHYFTYNGTNYETYDTAAISYKAGNNNVGGHIDFALRTLKCDESNHVRYDTTHGLYVFEQRHYEYDANWNTVKYTNKTPYPPYTGPLTNNNQELIEYDNNNNETLRLGFLWNKTSSSWDTNSRQTNVYDANNNVLFYHWERYYSPNGYIGYIKQYNVYDANNNLLNTVNESWITVNNAYDTVAQQIYHYNANQNADTVLTQKFNKTTRQWENNFRWIYSYTNGVLSSTLYHFWVNGQWENRIQTFTTQNTQTGSTVNISNKWDVTNSVWEKDTKDSSYTISTNPKVTERVYYTWSATTNSYHKTSKLTDAFINNNYGTSSVRKTWDALNNTWIVANYDDSTVWRYEGGTTNSVNELSNQAPSLTLYPNPANGNHITLQVSTTGAYTIAIYNIQGVLMAQQYVADGAQQKTIPVAHLANGQYIISVKSNEGNATRMFNISR